MDPVLVGIIAFIILFILMAAGMPIGFCMALVGFAGYIFVGGWGGALAILATQTYDTSASYLLTVLPLFILMGEFASASGLIKGAYSAAQKWLGHLPGGLAIATIGACASFAAVCGSSMATAGAMTSIAYPEMRNYKYHPALSAGSIVAGGSLGVLIPPSTVFIMYAIFAQESIGRLYIAGIIPGLLLTTLYMLTILIRCKLNPALGPSSIGTTWRERLISTKDILPVLVLAVVVLGGIWGGIFTANEAAGVGVTIAVVIGLILRKITRKNFMGSLMETLSITAMVFVILIGAMIFNYFIVLTAIPAELSEFVINLGLPPVGILGAIIIVYIILGCIMDSFAMTVLTLPIFLPIVGALGYDFIWFGVLYVVLVEMSGITPPIGMVVFVVAGMLKDIPMYTVFRGVMPFFGCLVLLIVLLIIFQDIAVWLPNSMIE
ncbi:MAG: TRAP transporter large permease subunit [Dehalococcoidales bacterium]|nr:TRAP transporter large permease subunit [Dehalococcoidales bacterium]